MAVEGGSKPKKPSATKANERQSALKKRKRRYDASAAAEAPATHPPSAKDAVPVVSAEEGAPTDGSPIHKKQRRHKRTGEQQEPPDSHEAARRQRQRELRELAQKLRGEGKEYVPPKKGAKSHNSDGGQQGQQVAKGRKARHYLGDKTPGWRPFDAVEVIVLPIFWNNNKEEKAAVLSASERARDILASGGVSVDMDASNKYTPGQKMKYWETMGVRVRVELGPRDVANGNCVVAISTKAPGEVATKNVVNMRHKVLDAVRAALEKVRSSGQQELEAGDEETERQAEPESDDGDQQQPKHRKSSNDAKKASEKKQQAAAAPKKAEEVASSGESEDEEEEQESTGGDSDDEDVGGAVAAAVAAVKSRKDGVLERNPNPEARKIKQQRNQERDRGRGNAGSGFADGRQEGRVPQPKVGEQPGARAATAAGGKAPHSADALEDDFGNIVEFEAEEDKLTLSKKERLKKTSKQIKAKRKADRFAEMGGSEDPGGGHVEAADKEGNAGAVREIKTGKKRPKMVTF